MSFTSESDKMDQQENNDFRNPFEDPNVNLNDFLCNDIPLKNNNFQEFNLANCPPVNYQHPADNYAFQDPNELNNFLDNNFLQNLIAVNNNPFSNYVFPDPNGPNNFVDNTQDANGLNNIPIDNNAIPAVNGLNNFVDNNFIQNSNGLNNDPIDNNVIPDANGLNNLPVENNNNLPAAVNDGEGETQIRARDRTVTWNWNPMWFPNLTLVPDPEEFARAIVQIQASYKKDPNKLMMTASTAGSIVFVLEDKARQLAANKKYTSPEKPREYVGNKQQWTSFCFTARTNYRLDEDGSLQKFGAKSEWKKVQFLENLYNILTEAHTGGEYGDEVNHLAKDKVLKRLKDAGLLDGIKVCLILKYISLCPHPTCKERRKTKESADKVAAVNKGKRKMEEAEEMYEAPEPKRHESEVVQEQMGQLQPSGSNQLAQQPAQYENHIVQLADNFILPDYPGQYDDLSAPSMGQSSSNQVVAPNPEEDIDWTLINWDNDHQVGSQGL